MDNKQWKKFLHENTLNESAKLNIVSRIEFYEDDIDDKRTIKIAPHRHSDLEVSVQKEYTQAETKKLEKELNSLLEKTINTFIKKLK